MPSIRSPHAQALGAKIAVLTAKHGCGFGLWPTKATLPDGSPYNYNVGIDRASENIKQCVNLPAEYILLGQSLIWDATLPHPNHERDWWWCTPISISVAASGTLRHSNHERDWWWCTPISISVAACNRCLFLFGCVFFWYQCMLTRTYADTRLTIRDV